MAVAESLALCKGFNQKNLIYQLFSRYENRPECYGSTSSFFFDLVKTGTLPHHVEWLVYNRRNGRHKNGSVMLGKYGNLHIITFKPAYPLSSRTDPQDGLKTGFYKKSAMIRNVSSGVHSCDKERTIKYAVNVCRNYCTEYPN